MWNLKKIYRIGAKLESDICCAGIDARVTKFE
mgnify:FL=1